MKRLIFVLALFCLLTNFLGSSVLAAPSVWNGTYRMYSPTSLNGLVCHIEVTGSKVRITMPPDGHVVYGFMDTDFRMIIPEWGNAEGNRDRVQTCVNWITWSSGHPSMKGHSWGRLTIE